MKENINNFKIYYGIFQQFIAILIFILFMFSLSNTYYHFLYIWLLVLIVIQFVISLLYFRGINLLYEAILLVLAFFGMIPLLGLGFRFAGLILSVLDLITFDSNIVYKKTEVHIGRK